MGLIIRICEDNLVQTFVNYKQQKFIWFITLLTLVVLLPTGCQSHQPATSYAWSSKIRQVELNSDDTKAGNFLAARQAFYLNDIEASAKFYLSALKQDDGNPNLLQKSFLAQYRNGNINLAAALARQLESINVKVSYAVEPAIAQAIKSGDWDAVMVLSDRLAENVTAAPQAGIIKAWALVAKSRGDGGLAELIDVGRVLRNAEGTVPAFIDLQLALMSEYLGYQDEAITYANRLSKKSDLTAKMILQISGVLARNGEIDSSQSVLERLPPSFNIDQLTEVKLTRAETITALIADAIVDIALAYRDTPSQMMLPARLQLVLYLDPNNDPARFFLAQSWIELKQFQRAKTNLAAIDRDSIWAQPKLLLQSDIETRNGNIKNAIDLISLYSAKHSANGYLLKELGDLHRRNDEFDKANEIYIKAILAGYDTADVYRNLAISHEQLGNNADAEINFKAALQRNPNDPFTLNYLGYWWAESGRNLNKSIKLIERAVRLRPNSGFFVDSLGWVHYQLGNFSLAVQFLEKATMLEPGDPLIVSHLGDAYWQSKRYAEARFKWNYALELTSNEALRDSVQRKIKSGIVQLGR